MKNVQMAFSVLCLVVSAGLILSVSGCDPKPVKPPKIEVEGHDTADWSGITVKYYYHHATDSRGEPPYVNLYTPEEVAQYKKQVEFLLKQLEDAERKMNIHEPEPQK